MSQSEPGNVQWKLMSDYIKVSTEDQVARVILTRPEVHNAFNDDMIIELTQIFNELSANNDIRVVILQSEGKSFSAGADLNWMKSMIDFSMDENKEDANRLASMLRSIYECSKPVIGRVQGATFGGGVGLTAACDLVAATESAFFSLSEAKLGLIPAVISPFVLRKISRAQAHRLFLTAEKFSAQKAHEIDLIDELCKDETELDATIDKWIAAILANGPEAVSLSKKLILETFSMSLDDSIDYSTTVIAKIRAGKEGQEGMRSFLEKRKANWIKNP